MNNLQPLSVLQNGGPILIEALEYSPRTLVVIAVSYLLLVATSGYVVRRTLSYADITLEDDSKQNDTGTAIGKVENILVLSLMLLGAYTALGVIFAAKSLVRKEDMDTGDTTYYLTGTLANFTYSILFGTAVHVLLWLLIQ